MKLTKLHVNNYENTTELNIRIENASTNNANSIRWSVCEFHVVSRIHNYI